MNCISTKNLNISYGNLDIVKDLNLDIPKGKITTIIGSNGCGKSTLLKIIAGLEKADNGQVSIKKNAKVAYLDQTGSSVVDDRPVYDILKDAFTELREKEQQIARLQKKMESGIEGEEYNKVL